MENKISFYKNEDEKKLRRAIDKIYNDYLCYEFEYENGNLDPKCYFTKEKVIEWIVKDILKEENYLLLEDSWEIIEAKHIRFMGEKRVREIVEHRVNFRYAKDGKYIWEK